MYKIPKIIERLRLKLSILLSDLATNAKIIIFINRTTLNMKTYLDIKKICRTNTDIIKAKDKIIKF
jgi:hypothetical protein